MDVPADVKSMVKAQRLQMLQRQYYDLALQKVMYNASGDPGKVALKVAQIDQDMQVVDARYNALLAVEVDE